MREVERVVPNALGWFGSEVERVVPNALGWFDWDRRLNFEPRAQTSGLGTSRSTFRGKACCPQRAWLDWIRGGACCPQRAWLV